MRPVLFVGLLIAGCAHRGAAGHQEVLAAAQAQVVLQGRQIAEQAARIEALQFALRSLDAGDLGASWRTKAEVAAEALRVEEALVWLDRVIALEGEDAAEARRRREELAVVGRSVPSWERVQWLRGGPPPQHEVVWVLWELWCPTCREEIPGLSALQAELAPFGVGVAGLTGLTRGISEEEAVDFWQRHGLALPIGVARPELYDVLAVSEVPTAVWIRGGVVVWRGPLDRVTSGLIRRQR